MCVISRSKDCVEELCKECSQLYPLPHSSFLLILKEKLEPIPVWAAINFNIKREKVVRSEGKAREIWILFWNILRLSPDWCCHDRAIPVKLMSLRPAVAGHNVTDITPIESDLTVTITTVGVILRERDKNVQVVNLAWWRCCEWKHVECEWGTGPNQPVLSPS